VGNSTKGMKLMGGLLQKREARKKPCGEVAPEEPKGGRERLLKKRPGLGGKEKGSP